MYNLDDITYQNNKKHNKKWPYIPDHQCIILIIGGSGSGKTNALLQTIIKKLFIRCRNESISLVFITQPYLSVPKDVRLNSTHSVIIKINSKRELQNIVINHSADIDYKDFVKIYRE